GGCRVDAGPCADPRRSLSARSRRGAAARHGGARRGAAHAATATRGGRSAAPITIVARLVAGLVVKRYELWARRGLRRFTGLPAGHACGAARAHRTNRRRSCPGVAAG